MWPSTFSNYIKNIFEKMILWLENNGKQTFCKILEFCL